MGQVRRDWGKTETNLRPTSFGLYTEVLGFSLIYVLHTHGEEYIQNLYLW